MTDLVNPQHYKVHPSGVEAIEICRHCDFALGNAIKYAFRADHKGTKKLDLAKARWYLVDARNAGMPLRLPHSVGYDTVNAVIVADRDGVLGRLLSVLCAPSEIYGYTGRYERALAVLDAELATL